MIITDCPPTLLPSGIKYLKRLEKLFLKMCGQLDLKMGFKEKMKIIFGWEFKHL